MTPLTIRISQTFNPNSIVHGLHLIHSTRGSSTLIRRRACLPTTWTSPVHLQIVSKLQCAGCDRVSPLNTGIIPPSKPHDPLTIPLRNLASPSRRRKGNHEEAEDSAALLDEKQADRHSSDSAGSDFSLWSDTGDLAEQLADEEDPLRINLDGSVEEGSGRRPRRERRQRHVRYASHDQLEHKITHAGVDKEAIAIPNPPQRQIGRVEKVLAVIMTGKNQPGGLVGKPLL